MVFLWFSHKTTIFWWFSCDFPIKPPFSDRIHPRHTQGAILAAFEGLGLVVGSPKQLRLPALESGLFTRKNPWVFLGFHHEKMVGLKDFTSKNCWFYRTSSWKLGVEPSKNGGTFGFYHEKWWNIEISNFFCRDFTEPKMVFLIVNI